MNIYMPGGQTHEERVLPQAGVQICFRTIITVQSNNHQLSACDIKKGHGETMASKIKLA
jgi:hypothetical protein